MSSLYGSVEDSRALKSHGRRTPLQNDDPGHTDDMRRPSTRASHGVRGLIVLGAMLLGYVVGSRVQGMRGGPIAGGTSLAQGETLVDVQHHATQHMGGEEPVYSLSLQARNEYGTFRVLELYQLDMLVEPYKESILSVTGRSGDATTEHSREGRSSPKLATDVDNHRSSHSAPRESAGNKLHWLMVALDEDENPIPSAPSILDVTTDSANLAEGGILDGPKVVLTAAGSLSLLTVTEISEDGRVVGKGQAVVACRYVRREIRSLTEEDREAFMDAMVTLYTTVPSDLGEESGQQVSDSYQYFAEVHNSDEFCYHNGMMFLTAHLAFDWVFERSLQRINPAVSLAFWDYTVEAGTLGADWPKSDIFGSDMFGSALGSPDNGYMISDGRFANVSSIYDPDSVLVDDIIDPAHNPYGYISAAHEYQDVPKLSRTHSFCGFSGSTSFSTCDEIIDCFEDNDSIHAWSKCLERNVHANMHGWLGGSWGCEVNMGEFQAEHPEYSDDLLVFVLQYITANQWPTNTLFSDYNECDTSCERGSDEPCGCTCLIDSADMTDAEVYALVEPIIVMVSSTYSGSERVSFDASEKYAYNFVQDGVRLEDGQLMLLARYMITVGCAPAYVGAMTTAGASPMDPIFWTLHPNFERALHVLWLSPQYRDTYDFSWVDGTCNGSKYTDELPFSEHDLGHGNSTDYLTNKDLLRIAHPTNKMLPYVYDNFQTWGTCSAWDPTSTSTDSA